ncbi:Whey acidic protein [Trichinella pseudospiralis]|uniref:Whey acidic protein n=3 Tax=Trichinella pseudospiralis TaxID=6337 RepID=A0A0V1E549_TRIPS|nr:Whey acidic protein [Trichinella pseudospiralis]
MHFTKPVLINTFPFHCCIVFCQRVRVEKIQNTKTPRTTTVRKYRIGKNPKDKMYLLVNVGILTLLTKWTCNAIANFNTCPKSPPIVLNAINKCWSDNHCQDNEQCCPTALGNVCLMKMISLYCPDGSPRTSVCNTDKDCAPYESCLYKYCCKINKTGYCPTSHFFDINFGEREKRCRHDFDCDGIQKCCRLDDGYKCITPLSEAYQKPGKCPSPNSLPDKDDFRCSKDSDCDGWKKCCVTLNGLYCKNPTVLPFKYRAKKTVIGRRGTSCPNDEAPVGVCNTSADCTVDYFCLNSVCCKAEVNVCPPLKIAQEMKPESEGKCSSDSDCKSNNTKCCATGTGKHCLKVGYHF